MGVSTLKTETESLCLQIEQLRQELDAKTIPFRDAAELWDSVFRPKALSLLENLLAYVPSRDLMVEFEMGNQRVVKSDERTSIEAPFQEELASGHLAAVVQQLRRLVGYLPVKANA